VKNSSFFSAAMLFLSSGKSLFYPVKLVMLQPTTSGVFFRLTHKPIFEIHQMGKSDFLSLYPLSLLNSRSAELIKKYTDCAEAPVFIDVVEKDGKMVPIGYYKKIFADTLETGWGGLVDFERLEKKTALYKETQAAFGYSKK
jgi:hypothetical protein